MKSNGNNRIELSWGHGNFSVLFNVHSRSLQPYAPKTERHTHEIYGGKNYYTSRSGLTGKGWVPKKTGYLSLATYRTDNKHDHIWFESPNAFSDWTITIPINYQDGTIDYKAPTVVYNWRFESLFILPTDGDKITWLLGATEKELSDRLEVQSWEGRAFVKPYELVNYKLQAYTLRDHKVPHWFANRLLSNSSAARCGWMDYDNDQNPTCHRSSFFMPLGYRASLDWKELYPVRGRFCRGHYEWNEYGLEAFNDDDVPSNVVTYDRSFYIQEQGDGSAIAHILYMNNPEYEYEIKISQSEWVRILCGSVHWSGLKDRCQAGLDEKIQKDQVRQKLKAGMVEIEEKRQEFLAKFADFQVTRQHSIDAGNCEPGTDRFISENHWGDRTSIPLSELAKYGRITSVSRVIDHVLLLCEFPEVAVISAAMKRQTFDSMDEDYEGEYSINEDEK